jgi:ABC-type Fe3+-hydroxamate transport system substrate-binding protein
MRHMLLFTLLLVCALRPCVASRTLTDETGRTVTLPNHPHRIICLVPSITDDVFSLSAGDEVVAISDYVQFPAEAHSKPSVGSISNPSLEAILALRPDLVLGMPHLNDQAVLEQLRHLNIPVYLVDPHGVAGILHSITSLGQATDRETQASAVVARLTQRIDAVRTSVKNKPVIEVFMPVSYDPVITIGQGAFITEIIALAGGRSITDDLRQEWPHISMEAVVARAPHALLMLRGGHTTIESLKDRPGWNVLPAVRAGRVYYVDKRVDFPSPVAIDALEDLVRQFHP